MKVKEKEMKNCGLVEFGCTFSLVHCHKSEIIDTDKNTIEIFISEFTLFQGRSQRGGGTLTCKLTSIV